MCSTKVVWLLLALHGVRSKEGATLDYVENQNDYTLSTLDPNITVQEHSEKAASNSENIASTAETVIDNAKIAPSVPSEESTEHIVFTELDRVDNSFESTVSQKTTSDETSSFIEVEEQKAKLASNENQSEDDAPVIDIFQKNSENDSMETRATTSHQGLTDSIISIKAGATNDDVEIITEETTSDEESDEISGTNKNDLALEDKLNPDTADLSNSSLTRRMLGGFQLDVDGKQALPSVHSEVISLPTVNSLTHVNSEPKRRKSQGQHLPLASTISTAILTLPSESRQHQAPNLYPKLDEIPSSVNSEVLIPLFRSLRPTQPALKQQIQPYLQVLASARPPIPYNQYASSPILERLQQVTQELQLNMAQQYADLHRHQWNPNPLLNNVYNHNRY